MREDDNNQEILLISWVVNGEIASPNWHHFPAKIADFGSKALQPACPARLPRLNDIVVRVILSSPLSRMAYACHYGAQSIWAGGMHNL
jgi:hypothetical protein